MLTARQSGRPVHQRHQNAAVFMATIPALSLIIQRFGAQEQRNVGRHLARQRPEVPQTAGYAVVGDSG